MPAGAATASTNPVPFSGARESLLDRSPTNANQGCFNACASIFKKDGRQYSERDKTSIEKKIKAKKGQKILAIAVDRA